MRISIDRYIPQTTPHAIHNACLIGAFPSEAYVRQADYFGMVSGKNVDKFAAAGLTPIRSSIVDGRAFSMGKEIRGKSPR
jgi:hypothetical protein